MEQELLLRYIQQISEEFSHLATDTDTIVQRSLCERLRDFYASLFGENGKYFFSNSISKTIENKIKNLL